MKIFKFIIIIFTLESSSAYSTSCKDVRTIMSLFLREHYSGHKFDKKMSKRVILNFIKFLDPAKMFFQKSEVEQIVDSQSPKLGINIIKAKCDGIERIYAKYSERIEEHHNFFLKEIQKKQDFSKKEFFILNRKSLDFAQDNQEIKSRWLKKIKYYILQFKKNEKDHKKIVEKLKKNQMLFYKRHQKESSIDILRYFLQAFSSSLGPHTTYMPPRNHEDFKMSTSLSLDGIGALLRSEDGITKVQEIIPGGAAYKDARLKPGDQITSVAQGNNPEVNVIDMHISDVVGLIRGKRGTLVRLFIRRDGKETIISLVREKIKLEDNITKSYVYQATSGTKQYKIGVIDLPSFYLDFEGRMKKEKNYRSSSRDVAKELDKLKKQKVSGILLDLRNNGGGSLDEAISISGLFIGKNPIVQVKDKKNPTQIQRYENEAKYLGPVVTLINRNSASASEILAGAGKDSERMLLVGDSTFGKGTVQYFREIAEHGAIKITVSKFYRPSGKSTQLRGVTPHIYLPSIADEYEMGEKYYDHPLKWEKIKSADYKHFSPINKHIEKLIKSSNSRTKKHPKFIEIQKNIDDFKKNRDSNFKVSLLIPEKENKEKKEKKTIKELSNKKPKTKPKEPTPKNTAPKDKRPILSEDPYLEETLKITIDFIRSLQNEQPQGISFKLAKSQKTN
jgi:carboxyl-terminal processing protease